MKIETVDPTSHRIDMQNYSRSGFYEYFKDFDIPISMRTINIDISNFYKFIKNENLKFSIAIVLAITHSANNVSAFKHRIVDGRIEEFDFLFPIFTALAVDQSVLFVDGMFSGDLDSDYTANLQRVELKSAGLLDSSRFSNQGHIILSNVPWYSFTSITLPYSKSHASIPVFMIGKRFKSHNKIYVPLAIQTNHALVDGFHISLFLESFERVCGNPSILRKSY
jgi:chloramphenicol O-acetyltransferase type A